MSGDRDFNKGIDICIIVRIFSIEKRFYIPIELKNNLEILTVNNLINIKKEGFFFINYQFVRSLKNKMNINMMVFLKSKKCEIFNGKKTHFIMYAIYLFIKIGNYYV